MSVFSGRAVDIWAQFHSQLVASVGIEEANGSLTQPMSVAQRVEWDSCDPDRNFWFKQDLVNTVPAWGPLYKRSTISLPDSYKMLLGEINSAAIAKSSIPERSILKTLEIHRQVLQSQVDFLVSDLHKQWHNYVAQCPSESIKPMRQWGEDLGLFADIKNKRSELKGTEGAMLLIANKAGGELKELGHALSALSAPGTSQLMPYSEQVAELGKDFWQKYYVATVDADIFNFRVESDPRSIVLAEGGPATPDFESRWDSHVEHGWCSFFDPYGRDVDQSNAEYFKSSISNIRITLDNVGAFDIVRPGWFKTGLIKRYVDSVNPNLFTRTGDLPLIPTNVILGRGLQIDIAVSEYSRDYFYHRHEFDRGGFSFGPFSFGIDGCTTTYAETKVTKTETGIHIEDTSNRAFVLGVVSNRPHDWLVHKPTPLWMQVAEQLGGIDRAYNALEVAHREVSTDTILKRITSGA